MKIRINCSVHLSDNLHDKLKSKEMKLQVNDTCFLFQEYFGQEVCFKAWYNFINSFSTEYKPYEKCCYCCKNLGKRSKKKKLLRRRHWSILIYPPPSLAWMGQEEWGHKKLFNDPLPPSCNRDKLQFSGGELINTIWPLLIFSFKSSTL